MKPDAILSTLAPNNRATASMTVQSAEPTAKIPDPELMKAAQEFEAAYITQMLSFSGLGDALIKNGGGDMEAFTSFYLEALAADITEKGGFGLAEIFYDDLLKKAGGNSYAPQDLSQDPLQGALPDDIQELGKF